ncbi:MAG: hypothetical protein D3923_00340 [Candidatus Electrothrix sp. AR3]|nr:hypothetical protein [Candidatus Electrothrix sp. AR3]
MATLQIKGIDDQFYDRIKRMAASENRSISQQVLYVVREYLAREKQLKQTKLPAETLLELSGSWQDSRKADEIIDDIRKNRRNSQKFSKGF